MSELVLLSLYRVTIRADVFALYKALDAKGYKGERARNTAASMAAQRSQGKHSVAVYRRELDEILDRPMRRLMQK